MARRRLEEPIDPLAAEAVAEAFGDPSDHPAEEAGERLALGVLGEDERLALVDHVTGCADCARVYRALAHLEDEARRADPDAFADAPTAHLPGGGRLRLPPEESGRFGRRASLWAGLAAAASLLAALWIGLPSTPPAGETGSPVLDEANGETAVGAGPDATERAGRTGLPSLELEAPLGRLGPDAPGELGDGAVFRWRPVQGAVSYRLELVDGLGEPLATWDRTDAASGWPDDVAQAPGTYYWRVRATLGAGGVVTSELRSFEIPGP